MSLSDRDVERIARRLAEILLEDRDLLNGVEQYVDASTLARRLGVSASYVYAHTDELGAIRLGAGSKPRLRFNVETAMSARNEIDTISVPTPARKRSARRAKTSSIPLLPIKGTPDG